MSDPVAIHTLEVSSEAFNNLLEMFEGSFNRDTIEQTYRVRCVSIFHLFLIVLNVVISKFPHYIFFLQNTNYHFNNCVNEMLSLAGDIPLEDPVVILSRYRQSPGPVQQQAFHGQGQMSVNSFSNQGQAPLPAPLPSAYNTHQASV